MVTGALLKSLENALRLITVLGGSTNAVLHYLAIAKAAQVDLSIDDFQRALNVQFVLLHSVFFAKSLDDFVCEEFVLPRFGVLGVVHAPARYRCRTDRRDGNHDWRKKLPLAGIKQTTKEHFSL